VSKEGGEESITPSKAETSTGANTGTGIVTGTVIQKEEERKEKAQEETGEAEDDRTWKELQEERKERGKQEERLEGAAAGKERSDALGARLSTPPYPQRWETIGARHLVEGGARADWIGGVPPTAEEERQNWTRRETYSGAMHQHMMRALTEELQKKVIEIIPAWLAPFVMAAFVVAKPDGRPTCSSRRSPSR
jgi:hypothetical protein